MNLYDSEVISGILGDHGYETTTVQDEAEVILVNTCSVREHAEQRALGRIRELTAQKASRPHLRIGVIGCMAQRLGDSLFDRAPKVDFVLGPDSYFRIADVLGRFAVRGTPADRRCRHTELDHDVTYETVMPARKNGASAWIAITRGCDNFCSYCIVPFVRGRLRSRSAGSIIDEARKAVADGFREVVLLGQNVNAYCSGNHDFAALLGALDGIEGLRRIRFTTSHPRAMTEEMLGTMTSLEKVCRHLHLPLQSGSNRILDAMNRGYTVERYLELARTARRLMPDICITTDILVGFPGERDDDLGATLRAMREAAFDSAFMFRYSPRDGTRAATLEDDVPAEEKAARLNDVIVLQKELTRESNRKEVGRIHRVLTEKVSRKNSREIFGRTFNFKGVVFPRGEIGTGAEVDVIIRAAYQNTLRGEPVAAG